MRIWNLNHNALAGLYRRTLARCEDLSDLNATDFSTMINTLRLLGNENAEFIATTGKGYRIDGRRHPHSWSVLDSEDTADWIEKMIENE